LWQLAFRVQSGVVLAMYAIIQDGGRQYQVQENEQVVLDYRDVPADSQLTLDKVLAIHDGQTLHLGKPLLASGSVVVKVLGAEHGEKLVIQKFRRRKNYRRRTGHRQLHTRVRIEKISLA